ncbi:MAG: hypothetical protein ACRC1H_14385, partial [Caldilineaceae bacterium]
SAAEVAPEIAAEPPVAPAEAAGEAELTADLGSETANAASSAGASSAVVEGAAARESVDAGLAGWLAPLTLALGGLSLVLLLLWLVSHLRGPRPAPPG